EEKVIELFLNMGAVDWTNKQSVAEYAIARSSILAGSKHRFDADKVDALARQEYARSNAIASMTNHAFVSGGESYWTRARDIDVPALIVHGTEDPIIPYEHGQYVAQEIPGAELLTLAGAGHELHEADWPLVIEAMIKHTSPRPR